MVADANDIVRVANGSSNQVETWLELLEVAGIESRIVGDDLTAGLGAALPGSVELWIHRTDTEAAQAALAQINEHSRRQPESHPIPRRGRPVSDPKPDHSRGPTHGAPPHRPLPS
jgi:hypothetical protein